MPARELGPVIIARRAPLYTTLSLANITSSQSPVDGGLAARHSTSDASHRALHRGDPARVVGTARPPARSPRRGVCRDILNVPARVVVTAAAVSRRRIARNVPKAVERAE